MQFGRQCRGVIAAVLLCLASPVIAAEDTPEKSAAKKPKPAPAAAEKTAPDPDQKERLDFFVPRLRALHVYDPAEPKRLVSFVETPLFRFENPVSFISDGFMFVWTDGGRPVVAMKSYYNHPSKSWGRTVVSLAERTIVMESDGKKLWTPPAAAVSFAPLKGAPAPAERPGRRLVQMRQLAERFSVVDNWGVKDPTDWQLRLLTTPLFRYEVPDENVVDAAMFGFVLTTSPEALVLLEARKAGDELTWHYAVSRCTRFGVTFSLDDKQLAEFPRLDKWPPEGAYFHDPLPMPLYPFPAIKKE